jgi:hypothetical protein
MCYVVNSFLFYLQSISLVSDSLLAEPMLSIYVLLKINFCQLMNYSRIYIIVRSIDKQFGKTEKDFSVSVKKDRYRYRKIGKKSDRSVTYTAGNTRVMQYCRGYRNQEVWTSSFVIVFRTNQKADVITIHYRG